MSGVSGSAKEPIWHGVTACHIPWSGTVLQLSVHLTETHPTHRALIATARSYTHMEAAHCCTMRFGMQISTGVFAHEARMLHTISVQLMLMLKPY